MSNEVESEKFNVRALSAPWIIGPGSITADEASVLLALWDEVGGAALEVGTSVGLTTRLLAMHKPWAHVFTVDCASPDGMHDGQRSEFQGGATGYFAVGLPNAHQFRCGFEALDIRNKGIRMVFIDGNHQEDAVERDTTKAMTLAMEAGGRFIVAWHDYEDRDRDDCAWLGVGRAVRRLASRWGMRVKLAEGTRIAFWRSWEHR